MPALMFRLMELLFVHKVASAVKELAVVNTEPAPASVNVVLVEPPFIVIAPVQVNVTPSLIITCAPPLTINEATEKFETILMLLTVNVPKVTNAFAFMVAAPVQVTKPPAAEAFWVIFHVPVDIFTFAVLVGAVVVVPLVV